MFSNLKGINKKRFAKVICSLFLSFCILIVTILSTGLMQAYRIVTVMDNGEQLKFATLKTETESMLESQNIAVIPQDDITVEDDGHNINITIDRAVNLSLTADGKTDTLCIRPSANVGDVLTEKNIELGADDMVNIEQNKKVQDSMDIIVTRVSHTSRAETEEVGYEEETIKTNQLFEGQTKIQTVGQNGEIIKYYEDKTVDGVVVESVEVGSNMITEPINEVVLVGTKKKVTKSSAAGNFDSTQKVPDGYRSIMTGRATAYCGGGTTATGAAAARGRVAVNPKKIPYGTRLYIVSQDGKFVYGDAIASDCGGATMNGSVLVDLYMDTKEECKSFGSRTVNVYIL